MCPSQRNCFGKFSGKIKIHSRRKRIGLRKVKLNWSSSKLADASGAGSGCAAADGMQRNSH